MSVKHVIQSDIRGDRGLIISNLDETISVKTDNTSVFINSQGALSSYPISQSFVGDDKGRVTSEFALSEGLATKEPNIQKRTGFNLDKSDNYNLDSSNTLATTKAVRDGVASREPIVAKKSGFNLDKSDSYTSNSTTTLATSKAVLDGINTREPVIPKQNGFNLPKSDSIALNDSNVLATAKAVNDLRSQLPKSDDYNSNSSLLVATTKAVYNAMNTREPAFGKASGFNLNKSDSADSNDSNTLATSKAVYDAKRAFVGVTDVRYTAMARFSIHETSYNTIEELGNGYLVTACTYTEKKNNCHMTARQLQIKKGGTWYTVAY